MPPMTQATTTAAPNRIAREQSYLVDPETGVAEPLGPGPHFGDDRPYEPRCGLDIQWNDSEGKIRAVNLLTRSMNLLRLDPREVEAIGADKERLRKMEIDLSWEHHELRSNCDIIEEYIGFHDELKDLERRIESAKDELDWQEHEGGNLGRRAWLAAQIEKLEDEADFCRKYVAEFDLWTDYERTADEAANKREAQVAALRRQADRLVHRASMRTLRQFSRARSERQTHGATQRGRASHRRIVVRVAAKATATGDPESEPSPLARTGEAANSYSSIGACS